MVIVVQSKELARTNLGFDYIRANFSKEKSVVLSKTVRRDATAGFVSLAKTFDDRVNLDL